MRNFVRNFRDLTGQRFGRLTALEYVGGRYWLCRCDCGNSHRVHGSNLVGGLVKSCGCLRTARTREANTRHGYARGNRPRSEYSTWYGMISRCHQENWINYEQYGGRGIAVCDRWRYGEGGLSGFQCFLKDMGDKPSRSHTLERIEGHLPYQPSNCRWATRKEQARNRRSNRIVTYRGERMLLCDALSLAGISESGFYGRLNRGWTEAEALATPRFCVPPRLAAKA